MQVFVFVQIWEISPITVGYSEIWRTEQPQIEIEQALNPLLVHTPSPSTAIESWQNY